jgi:hypothetical protein
MIKLSFSKGAFTAFVGLFLLRLTLGVLFENPAVISVGKDFLGISSFYFFIKSFN